MGPRSSSVGGAARRAKHKFRKEAGVATTLPRASARALTAIVETRRRFILHSKATLAIARKATRATLTSLADVKISKSVIRKKNMAAWVSVRNYRDRSSAGAPKGSRATPADRVAASSPETQKVNWV